MTKNSLLFKASLLSISLILASGPTISALIPLMHESFPGKSISSIELIATVPNFGILIFVLVSNFIIKVIGKKNTVILGLCIALIAGLMPVFSSDYTVVIFSRFMFGAGIGLYNALAVSLITEIYDGEEQASLMGLQGAMGSIGSSLMTLLVGYLTQYGWQKSFLVYAITVLPLILFALFITIPSAKNMDSEIKYDKKLEKPKEGINTPTIVLMIGALLVFALFFTLMLKTATLLVQKNIGQPSAAAGVLSTVTFSGILVGVIYGKIYKVLKEWVMPIGLFGLGVGFFVIMSANSIALVTTGAIISGVCFSLVAPCAFILVGRFAPKNSANLATSLLLVGINLGVFLSPTINAFISKLLNMTSASDAFLINGSGLIMLSLCSYVLLVFNSKKNSKK
ncbi:MFS transporter [Lactococcus carnosus]|uniref:MFS transporter n=1 Tax=Pseudolactococcus carnosus TaxID=2749961 RepID=UPI001FBA636B|nr:MFS transporter [Lactococcus carnosus]MCJ1968406.1 MFS transporter [Lactococcus carnosus]